MTVALPPASLATPDPLPKPRRAELRRVGEILLPCLIILAIQIGALFGVFRGWIDLWIFAGVHIFCVLIVTIWANAYRRGGQVNRFVVLLAVMTAALGPVGTLGLMAIVPLQSGLRHESSPFEEWYKTLFPDEVDDPDQTLYRQIVSGRADLQAVASVDSFSDVMRAGSLEQKRAVISLLVRQFRPEFAPALKLALEDPTPAIRVQAATAAAEIESDFMEASIRLEKAAASNPADFNAQLAVARHHDAYAFCGLLDPQRESSTRKKALIAYGHALALDRQNPGIRTAISRILVREQRYAEAVDWLGERLDAGRVNRSLVAWYVECLFHLHRWADLQGVVHRFHELLLGDPANPDAVTHAAELWLQKR